MKKNNILFTLLASACIGLTAGCGSGGTKFSIKAKVSSSEHGYIQGAGKYANGANVVLKVFPNIGCFGTEGGGAEYPTIDFTKEGATEPTLKDIALIPVGNTHYEYRFTLNSSKEADGNVGTYTANFVCASNDPSGADVNKKHTVKYKLFDGSTWVDLNEVEIDNGALAQNIKYTEDDKKITWHVGDTSTSALFDFTTAITEDKIIYGYTDAAVDEKGILTEVIGDFANVAIIKMKIGTEELNINNYNDPTKVSMVFGEGETRVGDFYIKGGKYFKVEGSYHYELDFNGTGFDYNKVADISKYFEHIKDIEDASYTVEKETLATEYVIGEGTENEIRIANKYVLKKDGTAVMEHYLKNGYIYKTVKIDGNVVNEIQYPASVLGPLNVGSANLKKMYTLKLELSETDQTKYPDLKNTLDEVNADFEKVLKSYKGYTVEELLNNHSELKEKLLRKFSFTAVRKGTTNPVNIGTDVMSKHETLVLTITNSYDDVKTALAKLESGDFKISSTIKAFGRDITEEYNVAAGTNLFTTSTNPGMNDSIWNMVKVLQGLDDSFAKFEFDSDVYSFYDKDKGEKYITIKIVSEEVTEIVYFEKDATTGKVITYTNTIS